ncbi:hypothetical protein Zm00014a_030925 [Zea mays]|uniref:Uncharacterized protein n=1 Tax=Zea mays TaxID=4577 RepID=A0A3L6E6S7_MAIZE|nr:hypothetical protein Zm00014a_030925 [Zea mays]
MCSRKKTINVALFCRAAAPIPGKKNSLHLGYKTTPSPLTSITSYSPTRTEEKKDQAVKWWGFDFCSWWRWSICRVV